MIVLLQCLVTFMHACETQPSSCPVQRWSWRDDWSSIYATVFLLLLF